MRNARNLAECFLNATKLLRSARVEKPSPVLFFSLQNAASECLSVTLFGFAAGGEESVWGSDELA
jgi:hypothetical protein